VQTDVLILAYSFDSVLKFFRAPCAPAFQLQAAGAARLRYTISSCVLARCETKCWTVRCYVMRV
jgi:hypothetical protein